MALKNLYHRRLVADSGAKSCWICFKPSTTVLITPDQNDWFYICAGHLTNGSFAIAQDAKEIAEKKKQEELETEIEAVKKEYEERMRKKKAKRQQKDGSKAEKDKAAKEAEEDRKEAEEKEAKLKELEKKKGPAKQVIDGPRIFELQKDFFKMRLQKKHDIENAKKNRDLLQDLAATPNPSTRKS